MKSTAVVGLVAAAVAACVAAAVVTWGRRTDDTRLAGAEGEPVVKGLAEKANDIAEVDVKSATGGLTIKREQGGAWQAVEKGGYPVAFEKVKQVIVGLAELRAVEPKTSKPELYARIGVQDPATGAAPAEGERGPTLVTLKDGQGAVVASVILGNLKYDTKPGVFVRRAGEAQSWLAQGQVDVPMQPAQWMDSKLLELPKDRVKSAMVTQASGEVLVVSREKPTDASFTVRDVPAGKELRAPTAGDPLGAALTYLNFDDVAPQGELKTEGEGAAKPKWTADFRTFDGLILVIQAYDRDGKVWAKITPGFDDAAAAPAEGRAPGLKSAEDAKKEADALNAKLTPWAFVLPDWKAGSIGVSMVSLLKDTPPAAPASMKGTEMRMPPGGTGAPAPSPAPTGATGGQAKPESPAPTGATGSTGPKEEPKPGS